MNTRVNPNILQYTGIVFWLLAMLFHQSLVFKGDNQVSELSNIISQIAEVESRLPALEDRLARTQLKSPVDGVINRLNFETLGGFVKPGDIVLEIVPTGDDLIVEGKIDPKDIAYIQPKQAVRISLTAYDASRYGTIDGEVLKVSADAVEDKATGITYYLVDVSIDTTLYLSLIHI